MLRTILYLLGTIFVVTLLRGVIGIVTKGVAELFEEEGKRQPSARNQGSSPAPSGGSELMKDPVCGTFVAPAVAVSKTVGGKAVYFCSPACRDKYAG